MKPIAILGIFGLLTMSMGLIMIQLEKNFLKSQLNQLVKPPNQSFGVILETHPSKKKISYQVPDEFGKIHEVTEYMDESTFRKIRVGDSITVYRLTGLVLGKRTILSIIEKNNEKHYYLQSIENLFNFFFFGFIYFIILIVSSFLFSRKE